MESGKPSYQEWRKAKLAAREPSRVIIFIAGGKAKTFGSDAQLVARICGLRAELIGEGIIDTFGEKMDGVANLEFEADRLDEHSAKLESQGFTVAEYNLFSG